VIREYDDRVRAYNLKSALKEEGSGTDTSSNFSQMESELFKEKENTLKVFDRFNVIISIFSQRASSKMAKLQVGEAFNED
jgi:hypothetical protein